MIKSAMGIGKILHDSADQIKKSLSVSLSFSTLETRADVQAKLNELVAELVLKC